MMSTLNWGALLRAGLSDLRLTPDQFWALTPGELMLLLGLDRGSSPMVRTRLDELCAAFPDPAQPDNTM